MVRIKNDQQDIERIFEKRFQENGKRNDDCEQGKVLENGKKAKYWKRKSRYEKLPLEN